MGSNPPGGLVVHVPREQQRLSGDKLEQMTETESVGKPSHMQMGTDQAIEKKLWRSTAPPQLYSKSGSFGRRATVTGAVRKIRTYTACLSIRSRTMIHLNVMISLPWGQQEKITLK